MVKFRICRRSRGSEIVSKDEVEFDSVDDAMGEIKRRGRADARNGFAGVFIYWLESREVSNDESEKACIPDKARP